MKNSFANRVRMAAQDFRQRGRTFTSEDVADAFQIQDYGDKKRIYNAIYDLTKNGEVKRVGAGVYTYTGKQTQPSRQKVMWNYIRMRSKCGATVTIEELRGAADISEKYAREWMDFLIKRGFVKKLNKGRFQLVKDQVDMPTNDEKAEKLRALRNKKGKGVRDILKEISRMALQAEEMLSELPE